MCIRTSRSTILTILTKRRKSPKKDIPMRRLIRNLFIKSGLLRRKRSPVSKNDSAVGSFAGSSHPAKKALLLFLFPLLAPRIKHNCCPLDVDHISIPEFSASADSAVIHGDISLTRQRIVSPGLITHDGGVFRF